MKYIKPYILCVGFLKTVSLGPTAGNICYIFKIKQVRHSLDKIVPVWYLNENFHRLRDLEMVQNHFQNKYDIFDILYEQCTLTQDNNKKEYLFKKNKYYEIWAWGNRKLPFTHSK
jgi:hypothetical protein